MFAPPLPPFEYDPETGTYRAMERFSSPINLAWTLVFGLVFFSLARPLSPGFWIMSGAAVLLAAVLIAANRWSARRRYRHHEQPNSA